jgi:cation transport regulator ChaB
MPYPTIADLPPAFKNLPTGAQTIAMNTMNAILADKTETPELVTQAVQAAWANIKREYRSEGGEWVRKWFVGKAVSPDEPTPALDVSVAHDLLAAEIVRRGKVHRTPIAGVTEKSWYVPVLKADGEKRLVYGIVLEPGDPKHFDSQGDWLKPGEIEESAHDFMRRYRTAKATMGLQHEKDAPEVDVVENYIAPSDATLGGEPVKKGSWVMAVYVGDAAIWKQIKSGELTGFSIGGRGVRED